MPSKKKFDEFREILASFYTANKRSFPWREPDEDGTFDPYKILVSEIMLQQTQTSRVVPYYRDFLTKYPDIEELAKSELLDVLELWKGLGYNRRARFLRDCAIAIQDTSQGKFPNNTKDLITLPGIGKNTAGAIMAYAYNKPEIFIETNIRSVYIHHFFRSRKVLVYDKEISELIAETIDHENPREFYWGLMDYGTYLKNQGKSYNSKSAHYLRQSPFEGSTRQLRSKVLNKVMAGPVSEAELAQAFPDSRLRSVVTSLITDRLVESRQGLFFIPR